MMKFRRGGATLWTLALFLLAGCAAQPDVRLIDTFYTGELGVARQYLKQQVAAYKPQAHKAEKLDRNFALDFMRLGITLTADGYAPPGISPWDKVYYILRRQGINEGSDVGAFFTTEELARVWKGEPFEQALAYHFVGMHYALQGSWDNARTAYENSLFQLMAVVKTEGNSQRINTQEVINRFQGKDDSAFVKPTPEDTDFALGYLMRGLCAMQIYRDRGDVDRLAEAKESFAKATSFQPRLKAVTAILLDPEAYNTVLVVDFGRGPQKVGVGEDSAIAAFQDLTSSDDRGLELSLSDGSTAVFPLACDVNRMAQDHRWNNLEDMRKAKSYLGTALVIAGAGATSYGSYTRNDAAVYAGLGAMVAGVALKATAYADTRYCELMPQRIYVVPARIHGVNQTATLQIEGWPGTRMVLANLAAPTGKAATLHYVRLLTTPSPGSTPVRPWTSSGQVLYGNDYAPYAGTTPLPYILGGTDVSTPTEEALARYRAAGFLQGMTLDELQELYRLEGITWTVQDEDGVPGLHVLEGGKSLLCPRPGSLGYARLFGRTHLAYRPVSAKVRQLQAELAPRLKPGPADPNLVYSR